MEPQVPFEEYARPRPMRTYSHKVRTASPSVLPLLRTRHSPASLAREHQHEIEPRNEDRHDDGIIPEEDTFAHQAHNEFEEANELKFGTFPYIWRSDPGADPESNHRMHEFQNFNMLQILPTARAIIRQKRMPAWSIAPTKTKTNKGRPKNPRLLPLHR